MSLPPRFAALKATLASSYGPNFEENATRSWGEILEELNKLAEVTKAEGSDYIPQVNFSDLHNLSRDEIAKIKSKGVLVIKDVVPDEQALKWKEELKEYVRVNPGVEGIPEDDKQFFLLYWTRPQVQARAHPNVLAATVFLNNLYEYSSKAKSPSQANNVDEVKGDDKNGGDKDEEAKHELEGVDLNTPLTYADRFRIRKPGLGWEYHPPHVDGGGIERWEDPNFRQCFASILQGNWRAHNPFSLAPRLNARTSLYGRPNQATVFRTFQGWLALSETAPKEGTLQVFPDVVLSNAYTILRPFFTPIVDIESEEIYDLKGWKFDISSSSFPGIRPHEGGYYGPRPTPSLHPNMRLDQTMLSVPRVKPGDMVFWHCDVVHAVEREHVGVGESAVMYIPAVPLTPSNKSYIQRQAATFLQGKCPPDMPQGPGEAAFVGTGRAEDVCGEGGRRAMGLVDIVA